MKLMSFEHAGKASFGVVVGDGVFDLQRLLERRFPDLKSLLDGDGIALATEIIKGRTPDLKLADVRFLPVIPNPDKIWCVGLNYGEHVRETGREISEKPMFFLRVADSQVGHGEAITRPPESIKLDYEGEIAIIIGKGGRRIREEDAWDHIAGYACYNDGSVRDWQLHTAQWAPGKNFWRTGGFGPWMVTTDEIEPGATLSLVTRLNGQEVQRATTDMMLHSIPRQIAYASTVAPLRPGDVFVTGTPGGIGAKRTPPLWMKPGDVVEVEVERVGTLRNTIVDEHPY
ncbi:fumarylacetoacetate hydrolase family protein [Pseudomonas sp. N-137]|uniref:fumarylacetoacetate hydrolase family protein n=1 Tax=Pseudomonas sp. N-137 TaxID=3108452 RepID=UPI002ADEEB45|nr:fumarylacetoacetate hydrolase family protein [Pseudomonas sp. N-137]MEA1028092.1 fumarylacetoacetate hydrolase family protein [Pseudomonas sp. N-137]